MSCLALSELLAGGSELVAEGDEASLPAPRRGVAARSARVEGEVGLSLTSTSAAPLRLAVMMLVMRAYERGDGEMSAAPVEGWLAPYRVVRL